MVSEKEGSNIAEDVQAQKRRAATTMNLNLSIFQSVIQHVISMQAEPMLIRELCQGDGARAVRLMANTTGLVGMLSLGVNQIGGKMSDAIGRKNGLLLGPIVNIFVGAAVFSNSANLTTVLIGRCLRMIFTTFSSTVMIIASHMDNTSGAELGIALSRMQALVGLALIVGPFLEEGILKRSSPKYTYLGLSIFGLLQTLYNSFVTPETLSAARRINLKDAFKFQNLNPLAFVKIYSHGSKTLQNMVNIMTLQMFTEGKNLADMTAAWWKDQLQWEFTQIRNFVAAYGSLCTICGMKLTPLMLKKFSLYEFTTITNMTNLTAYILRGFSTTAPWYIWTTPFLLPGVNGQSASAIKGAAGALAVKEGFGAGEFSAHTNNLRALVGAIAPVLYGNSYAWALKHRVHPGVGWWLAAFLASVLPQILLMSAPKTAP